MFLLRWLKSSEIYQEIKNYLHAIYSLVTYVVYRAVLTLFFNVTFVIQNLSRISNNYARAENAFFISKTKILYCSIVYKTIDIFNLP